jgi:iron complex outermembrane recepter protein
MNSAFTLQVFIFTLLAMAVATSSSLYGQSTTNDSLRVEFEEIVVESAYSTITMDRAPLSISYKFRDLRDIASRPAATMDELSFTLPGVYIANRENYALGERMTIRGLGWRSQFGVRGVQVILDDMPLTVADGQTIMNMIDPAVVQRIELLRGPSATFWGNSSGGVLHLSTKPEVGGPAIQYRGYGGSHQTVKQELKFNTQTGRSHLYGYGTYFQTDGFRDHSAARLFRAGVNLERELNPRNRLLLRSAFTSMPKAEHPGALNREDAADNPASATPSFVNNSAGKQFDQAMVSASLISEQSRGIWNLTANGTYRDLHNPLPFGYIGLERLAGGLRTTYEATSLPFDWSSGVELKVQQDDRFETDNDNGSRGDEVRVRQTETVTNSALFTRSAMPITERFTVSAGVRADWLHFNTDDEIGAEQEGSRTFFSVNPSVGLNYRMDRSRLFINFSTSFESPTTTELVNRPEGGNGFNQNVNPERSVSLESGIQGGTGSINYDITLFGMRVYDLLFPYQIETDGPTFFRNEGNTVHYGAETAVTWHATRSILLETMFTFLNAQFSGGEYDGNELPGVAPVRFGSILSFTPGRHYISLDTEWIGSYMADNENSVTNDSYALVNLRYSITLENLLAGSTIRPFISVHNLFNTRYNTSVAINAFGGRYFEPGSDRWFRAGLHIDLF